MRPKSLEGIQGDLGASAGPGADVGLERSGNLTQWDSSCLIRFDCADTYRAPDVWHRNATVSPPYTEAGCVGSAACNMSTPLTLYSSWAAGAKRKCQRSFLTQS